MKIKFPNIIFNIIIIFLTIIVFLNPEVVSSYFFDTLMFIIKIIIPSLVPFMIFINFILYSNSIDYLAKLFTPLGKLLKLSGYGVSCLIASLLGGFPYSSIIVSNFVKLNKLDITEANRLINYCKFPSISFLFVGLLRIDNKFIYIIVSIYLSSLILLLISSFKTNFNKSNHILKISNDISSIYTNVVNSTIKSIVSISFSILLFSILSSLLTLIISNQRIIYYISGILEFSNSSINILMIEEKTFFDYLIVNIIISFTSLSIIFQSMSFLKEIDIKIKQLLIHRLIIVLLSTLIFTLLYFI